MQARKESFCWCGTRVSALGHPQPHFRPPKARRTPLSKKDEGCTCGCHTTQKIEVFINIEPCCPKSRHGTIGIITGSGGKGPPPGDTGGKIPSPPPGVPENPWNIIETILLHCRGDTPPPRKDSYLPYLLIRSNPSDTGSRPLPNGTIFWESPDIFVMPNQSVQGAPGTPSNLGGMAQAGAPNTIFAHVWNLGRSPAFNARVEFYWFNPTLGIEASGAGANLVGFTYVTLGSRDSQMSHRVVMCPVDWIPTYVNRGHECLVVRVFSPMTDALGPNEWYAYANRHVAQRNIAVLKGADAQSSQIQLEVPAGQSAHKATVTSVQIPPDQVPWMQLITMKRDPGVKQPIAAPVFGTTTPGVAGTESSNPLNMKTISDDALSQILSPEHSFTLGNTPLQVSFAAKSPPLAANEANVVRVHHSQDGKLVGGYTIIMLPD